MKNNKTVAFRGDRLVLFQLEMHNNLKMEVIVMNKKTLMTMFATLALFSGNSFFASQQEQVQKGPIDDDAINALAGVLDDFDISEAEVALIEQAAKEGFSPFKGGKELYSLAKELYGKYKTLPEEIKQDLNRIKLAPAKRDSVIAAAPLVADVTMLLSDLEQLLGVIRMYFIPASQRKIRPILGRIEKEGKSANVVLKEIARMLTNPDIVQPSSAYADEVENVRMIVEERLSE